MRGLVWQALVDGYVPGAALANLSDELDRAEFKIAALIRVAREAKMVNDLDPEVSVSAALGALSEDLADQL